MLYMWTNPDCPDKHIAQYDGDISPDDFFLRRGVTLNIKEFNQCDCYVRSSTLDLPDDLFLRMHLRQVRNSAYIFTPTELFYFNCGIAKKVRISIETLQELKIALSLTEQNIDTAAKILSNQELQIIYSFKDCPKFSRTPILYLRVAKDEVQKKYDCISNTSVAPLVNQKVIDVLMRIAPNDVQFFDAEVHCTDGVLIEYKLVNFTHKIIGIDHEKSIYSKILSTDAILGFRYLTYKPDCMKDYKLARDEEYLGNKLVIEEVKDAFEAAKIKGANFIMPENFYGDI